MKAAALLLLLVGVALASDWSWGDDSGDDSTSSPTSPTSPKVGPPSKDPQPSEEGLSSSTETHDGSSPGIKPSGKPDTPSDELDDGAIRHSNIEGANLDEVGRRYLAMSVNRVRDSLYPDQVVSPRFINFLKPNSEELIQKLKEGLVLNYQAAPVAVHCDKKATLITSSVEAQERLSIGGELSGIVQGDFSGSHASGLSADEHSSLMVSTCTITVARVMYQPGQLEQVAVDPLVDDHALESLVKCPAHTGRNKKITCGDIPKWFEFFNKYGTHGIRAIRLGGKITVKAKVNNRDLNRETVSEINGRLQGALSDIIKNKEFKADVAKVGQEEPAKEPESEEDAAKREDLMREISALQKLLENGKDLVVDLMPVEATVGVGGDRKSESSRSRKRGAVSYSFVLTGGNLKGGYPVMLHEESGSTGQYYPSVNRDALIKWMESLTGENVQPIHVELGTPFMFFGDKLKTALERDNIDEKALENAYKASVKVYESFYDRVQGRKNIIAKGRKAQRNIYEALENFSDAEEISKGSILDHGMPYILGYRITAAAVLKFCETSCDLAQDLSRIERDIFELDFGVKHTDRADCIRLCKDDQAHKLIEPTLSRFGIDTGGNPRVGYAVDVSGLKEGSGWVQRVDRGFFKRDYKVHLTLTVKQPGNKAFTLAAAREAETKPDIMELESVLEYREKGPNTDVTKVIEMNKNVVGVMFGLPNNRPGFRVVTRDKVYSFQTLTPQVADVWCDAIASHQIHFRIPALKKAVDPKIAQDADMFGHLFLPIYLEHYVNNGDKKICDNTPVATDWGEISDGDLPEVFRMEDVDLSETGLSSSLSQSSTARREEAEDSGEEAEDSGASTLTEALLNKSKLELAELKRETESTVSADQVPREIIWALEESHGMTMNELQQSLFFLKEKSPKVDEGSKPNAKEVPSSKEDPPSEPIQAQSTTANETPAPVVSGASEAKALHGSSKPNVVKESGPVNSFENAGKDSLASGEVTAKIVSEGTLEAKDKVATEHPVEEEHPVEVVKSLSMSQPKAEPKAAPKVTAPVPAANIHAAATPTKK